MLVLHCSHARFLNGRLIKTGVSLSLVSPVTVGMLEENPSPKGEVLCFPGSKAGDVDAAPSPYPTLLTITEAGELDGLVPLERSSNVVGDSPLVTGDDPVATGLECR